MTIFLDQDTTEQAQAVGVALAPFADELASRHTFSHCEMRVVYGVVRCKLYDYQGHTTVVPIGVRALAAILAGDHGTRAGKLKGAVDLLLKKATQQIAAEALKAAGVYL